MSFAPATEKQVNFLVKLVAERRGENAVENARTWAANASRKDVSAQIERMLQLPKLAVEKTVAVQIAETVHAAPAEPMTDGIFFKDGVVYKVQKAVHGSGHLYAKSLNTETGKFEYAPGAVRTLTVADKMTREQAAEFGKLYGMCCVCSRTLTNEESIEAGIGPVCGGRLA